MIVRWKFHPLRNDRITDAGKNSITPSPKKMGFNDVDLGRSQDTTLGGNQTHEALQISWYLRALNHFR